MEGFPKMSDALSLRIFVLSPVSGLHICKSFFLGGGVDDSVSSSPGMSYITS